ncbi:dUTP diphosphatase [Bacillus massiliglaciei]|uniref:dUTP diphosphatase n=1 Tax=Bacillus massiliglaciei TaxID=1816693 RepID=UPI000A93203C|nr:dUTP diphosphatase [Bacillus massiliglaciei]
MNVAKLMEMQKALDRHIETKHGLGEEDLLDRKILALLTEVGELANETRCFKFWSQKGPSEKEIIAAEYVDGIHFILSIGLELGLQPEVPSVFSMEVRSQTEQFLQVFHSIVKLRESKSSGDYQAVFGEYLRLGKMLGFSAAEIEEAYVSKNEVNYERQKKGY